MALTPQWLDELRARVSLSGVIGRTTRLTKAGREFKACCPFHSEKSPSFTVNDDKGFYHCFGCGAHGDVIRWMTDQRGLAFMDAVRELAGEAGMELPAMDPKAAEKAERAATLGDVTAAAQAWFVEQLRGSGGEAARRYLDGRGFPTPVIERFGFGFAPAGRQALREGLHQFSDELLIEAGLRIVVEGKDPYDRFRNRLMLPIRNPRGGIVGFGGRILDGSAPDAPKYLNSPDTALFDKGRTLYNLDTAGPPARKSGRMVVVEGYMDVVALAAAGIEEVVAPLGTALTEAQIELLWRVCETPVLCFDGDAAGQRAATRAMHRALPLLRPAHSLAICRLPAGLDPDDLVKARGSGAMLDLLGGAQPLVEALWEAERDAVPLVTPEDKAGLKARLLAHVETIGDQDVRALYRRELTERFSAFAYPPRAPFVRSPFVVGKAQRRPLPGKLTPEAARTLHLVSSPGDTKLLAAVIAGLIRFPAAIARHGDALGRLRPADARLAALLDALLEAGDAIEADNGGVPLESAALVSILASRGLQAPAPNDYAKFPYAFLARTIDPVEGAEKLAQAVDHLVGRAALETALDAMTERFALDPEGAIAEQARLRNRKLASEDDLMQRATARAAPESAPQNVHEHERNEPHGG